MNQRRNVQGGKCERGECEGAREDAQGYAREQVRAREGAREGAREDTRGTERERDIEQYLVQQIRRLGGKAYKWTSPGNAGVPDRIVFLPQGRVVFVELKTRTGKLTRLQRIQIETIKGLGQDVRVLYGREQVEEFLAECWEAKRNGA